MRMVNGLKMRRRNIAHHLMPKCISVTTRDQTLGQAGTIIRLTDKRPPTTGCYFSNLRQMPDIEIYIDGVGQAAAWPSTTRVACIFVETLIHEICHHEGFNEEQTRAAVKRICF